MNDVERYYFQGLDYFNKQQMMPAKDCLLNAASLAPRNPKVSELLGAVYANLEQVEEARNYFERAIKFATEEPSNQLLINYARILIKMGDYDHPVMLLELITKRNPESVHAWSLLAQCHSQKKEIRKSMECYEKGIALQPDNHSIIRGLQFCYHSLCMWDKAEKIDQLLVDISDRAIKAGRLAPLLTHAAMLFSEDGYLLKKIAISRCKYILDTRVTPRGNDNELAPLEKGDRIRVGYISNAFSKHATAVLNHAMFEHHDREKFEIFVYAVNPDDQCDFFRHIKATTEHVIELNYKNDYEIAAIIKSHDLDILIDRAGIISGHNQLALSLRPAPIQITWLGTPSTSGAPWIDYILTDEVITPPEYEDHYTEEILRMPDCYAFNSFASMQIKKTDRKESGLPADKFVFASFNISRKIDRETFYAWCEILQQVENSVLWVLIDDEDTTRNLKAVMEKKGLDPDRLINAKREKFYPHMERLSHADLLLDCFICGAHTTCAEALYAELPVLTKIGKTFPARVAASILTAADMTSCITQTKDEYVRRAVQIATDPEELAALKTHLKDNKYRLPLFDQKKWVKNMENILTELMN